MRGQLQALDRVDQARALGMDRLGQAPRTLGQARAETLAPRRLLDEYYRLRGWTPDGIPEASRLSALQI